MSTLEQIVTTPILSSEIKQKTKKSKKRKLSKHVQQSIDERKNENNEQPIIPEVNELILSKQQTPKKKSKKNKRKIKDPIDVASYLSLWKAHQEDNINVQWKFNKNTQSWLIRHMYETDKVPKAMFVQLIEYLSSLQGDSVKIRMLEEATRRALRYKQYEKLNQNNNNATTDVDEEVKMNDEVIIKDQTNQQDIEDDEIRWNKLDDNNKRKEYKRARKILETFQN